MKRVISTICLTLCLLALVASVSAQENLNFQNLPTVSLPSPMPNGYGKLGWGNFYYVDPFDWSGAGPGFRLRGLEGGDVVFIGAKECRLVGYTCFGTLSNTLGFQLVSASVAAGFGPTSITITAYNKGKMVGSANYSITTEISTLNFPSQWGLATEVVIQVNGIPDDLVLYDLSLYTFGG